MHGIAREEPTDVAETGVSEARVCSLLFGLTLASTLFLHQAVH